MENQFNGLDTFEHIVVLMLENRSFDNLLGYLYSKDEVQLVQIHPTHFQSTMLVHGLLTCTNYPRSFKTNKHAQNRKKSANHKKIWLVLFSRQFSFHK